MRDTLRCAALVSALLSMACQGLAPLHGPRAEEGRLQKVLARQELRVGLSAAQPPLNMKSRTGELIGLEVDLAKALARSMKLELHFVQRPFEELLDALEADQVDLVISGMSITPERNARVAFAGPYLVSGQSIVTRSKELAQVPDVALLDDPARRYAALEGSTSYALVEEVFPEAKLVGIRDYDTAVEMLEQGQIDALIADFPICALSLLRYPNAGLMTLATPFTVEPLGVALPADSPLFVNLVENYLRTMERTGTLVRLKARWFSPGAWLDELP